MPDEKDKIDADKPKPLTIEDVQAIVSKTVNGTVKDHVKRALATDDFKTLLSESMKSALQATKDEVDEDGDQPPAGDKAKARGEGGKFSGEVEKRLKQLERDLERSKAETTAERQKREKTELEQAQAADRGALAGALKAKGVREELVEAAVALHYGRSAKRGDDGKLRWHDGEDELDVEAGVEKWAKTPAGQAFLPPRAAAGSGGTAAGRPGAGGKVEYTDADLGTLLGQRTPGG